MFKLLLALVALVVCVNGHGWMYDPIPRGFVTNDQSAASQTSPCGLPGNFTYPGLTIPNYGTSEVLWNLGGGHTGNVGSATCYFAWGTDPTKASTFTVFSQSFPCVNAGSYAANLTVYVPNAAANTTYYLQFNWAAGDGSHWYNCAQMAVTASNIKVTSVDLFNGIINTPVNPGNVDFYSVFVLAGQFEYVAITGPSTGNIIFEGKVGNLPTLGNYDSSVTVDAGASTAVSFCGSNANATEYIAVYNDPSNTGSYAFIVNQYPAQILYGDSFPQISDGLPSGGSKFYYTGAYSTADVPKMIILSGPANFKLRQHVGTCTSSSPSTDASVSGGQACVQLSSSATQNKYLEVVSTDNKPGTFTLGIEQGSCTSSSATVKVSLFMMLAALLVFLL